MAERGAYTLAEIQSQPDVWADTLKAFAGQVEALGSFWRDGHYDDVIFTGCGSTYYLSLFAAALFRRLLGISARAVPGSELLLFSDQVLLPGRNPLLMTVSRSGETTETVESARLFRRLTGNAVAVVTCYPDSTLAVEGDFVLAAPTAQEESVAQTRSYSSMALIVEAMAAELADLAERERLVGVSAAARHLFARGGDLARQLGEDRRIDQFFFLGSGLHYGMACEAMLKMKEMSLSHSEAFHVLEFRHGPMSMVTDSTLVVGLLSDSALEQELAVLRQMRAMGAQVLALTEHAADVTGIDGAQVVGFESGVPEWGRPILYLPILQSLAYHRAMTNGQNPDRPARLSAVIVLK